MEIFLEYPHFIRERRILCASYYHRREKCITSEVHTWIPKHVRTNVGHPRRNYIDQLKECVGLYLDKMRSTMMERDVW